MGTSLVWCVSFVWFSFVQQEFHFFWPNIIHGDVKYREICRGFVVEHKRFAENYCLYARIHFMKAIELALFLTLYAVYRSSSIGKNTFYYIDMTIYSWFLVLSLEEQAYLKTTGMLGKAVEIVLKFRFFFFQYAVVYQPKISNKSTSIDVYLISWIYVFFAFGIYMINLHARDRYSVKEHIYYWLIQFLVITFSVLCICSAPGVHQLRSFHIFTTLLAFVSIGWGIILIAQVFRSFL
ncbi:hypothetical protein SAY86_010767 [Trapa natans]|uniref:Glycosyl transferase 48 domain-containing protein n=1 Tax=Trapa natans TaxID=22666 RepID=A0AAN7R0E5_TRANT|nr:hypothetical protein SAY86_010767 [Trapa natans]